MPGVTKDQLARAREIDVFDYISTHESGDFKRVGGGYRRKDHPSIEVKPGKWRWYSQNLYGRTALDYLTDVRGYGLVEAVCMLLSEAPAASRSTPPRARPPTEPKKAAPPLPPPTEERKPFSLPLRNGDNSRVIDYLQNRGIDKQVILDCIERGSLYESARFHNCVFVGRDDKGKARFAAMRGTHGDFKCDADGSDKRYGFTIPPNNPNSREIAVFEAPIDCISHQTLCNQGLIEHFDGWRLSLGGTSLCALTQFFEVHPEVTHCIVCTDNDKAGNKVAADIAEFGGITVARSPPVQGKDWNETLISMRNEVKPMDDKRKDIRFITSDYKTLFTVKDGDSIKFTSGYDGEVKTLKCRHIDEAHTRLIGKHSDDYHICELAEKLERNGSKCEPIPGQRPMLDVIAAKYGEALKDATIPMTEAAIRKLVGGKYDIEKVYYGAPEWKNKAYAAILRGKDGIAVLGISSSDNDSLTSLHPYNAQTLKRELDTIEPPAAAPQKRSLHEKLDSAKGKAAEQTAAKAQGNPSKKRDCEELG